MGRLEVLLETCFLGAVQDRLGRQLLKVYSVVNLHIFSETCVFATFFFYVSRFAGPLSTCKLKVAIFPAQQFSSLHHFERNSKHDEGLLQQPKDIILEHYN